MDPKFNKNGILPSCIDMIFRIDHLFSIVLDLYRLNNTDNLSIFCR